MADNVYVVDDLASGSPQTNVTDDGIGVDWLVIEGEYTSVNVINLSYSVNSSGQATSASGLYFDEFGSHRLVVTGEIENVSGSNGSDRITGNSLDNLVYGDSYYGTPTNMDGGNDTIDGMAGDDTIYGGAGRDELLGGGNNDTLYGGEGNDYLVGNGGDDVLRDGDGSATIDGDAGNDLMYGGYGNEYAFAGNGNDLLYGEAGNDFLYGESGNDTIYGGSGNDEANGGDGDDKVYGADGNDSFLSGFTGNDVIYGGQGKDTIAAGNGRDLLYGGGSGDVFQFQSASESGVTGSTRDVIKDFSTGQGDRISLFIIDTNTATFEDEAFTFIGYSAFTGHKGELRAQKLGDGSGSIVSGDLDGDKVADFSILVETSATLKASDFIL